MISQKSSYSWLERYVARLSKKYSFLQHVRVTREFYLLLFFGGLFFVLFARLFYVQIIRATFYDDTLNNQHISKSSLEADRWHIYVYDKSGKPIQLTENISMYNVFVDPHFVWDKAKFIEIITPVVYTHLCETFGMQPMDTLWCIKNIQNYAGTKILPDEPQFFYYGSGIVSSGWLTFDRTGYNEQLAAVLSGFTTGQAQQLISSKLEQRIQLGIKPRNYVGFFTSDDFLEALRKANFPFVTILYDNYVYIEPTRVTNVSKDVLAFKKILDRFGYLDDFSNIDRQFSPQENRYVRIMTDTNPIIAQEIKKLKQQYYSQRTADKVPLLHGLGLEPYTQRYYPFGGFLSHVLGYVNKNKQVFYGIEQYFDSLLAGSDGEIIGRASAWMGQVWANEFEIKNVVPGSDVYLTIDPGIQKEVERIIKWYNDSFRADSTAVLVYDPWSGHIIASASYPNFDANSFNDAFTLKPLDPGLGYVVDDETYIDVPVYIQTWGIYKLATTIERNDVSLQKFIAKNVYGAQVFVDRNISLPYEPGSIFKAFTMWAAFDVDEVRLYDFYNDPGQVDVGPFTIKNAAEECFGDHSFLHALVYSCNVWMVRVAQKIGKNTFYNYVEKLGFGKLTNIELAQEGAWQVESVANVSLARYFNNAFGQWLLVTPMQIAAAYAPLVNGWYYVKPTIIAGIRDGITKEYQPNNTQVISQIFRSDTATALKDALFSVIQDNPGLFNIAGIPWFTLGGKSGTSQIAFKGEYQAGNGWTNASFVGIVTRDNPKYIVVVQVRRPRSTQWWGQTGGKVFKDIAQFLLNYSMIEK